MKLASQLSTASYYYTYLRTQFLALDKRCCVHINIDESNPAFRSNMMLLLAG